MVIDGSDLRPFREASEQIAEIWASFGAPVERLGFDEAFLDITGLVQERLQGIDTPCTRTGSSSSTSSSHTDIFSCSNGGSSSSTSQNCFPSRSSCATPSTQDDTGSTGESFNFRGHLFGDPSTANHTMKSRLAAGSEIVSEMRAKLFDTLGFTCSGGVSISKLGAKLAAEVSVPNPAERAQLSDTCLFLPTQPELNSTQLE